MLAKYNILVTGCGGDIGQSIGKILKSIPIAGKVIGCDMNEQHAGKFIFDKVRCIPSCRSVNYLSSLEQVILDEKINLVIPVSEPELRFFSEKKIEHHVFDKPLITADSRSLKVGLDKLATANFLKENQLPYPETIVVKDLKDPSFPFILKSRDGSGGKSLYIIRDHNDFSYYSEKFPDYLAQELIGSDSDEYTCGLFRSSEGEIRHIIYRRKLIGGYSGYGSLEVNPDITELLINIAEKINLIGSINVQLRMSGKGPCVFEINPRFSSTVMFRHLMGFEDVLWSIQNALKTPISTFNLTNKYRKFYKGYQEYVD